MLKKILKQGPDFIFVLVLAMISAGMFAYPLWDWVVILVAFVISFVVLFGMLYGILVICIPKEGMSNNIISLFVVSLVAFCGILLIAEGKIISIMHVW